MRRRMAKQHWWAAGIQPGSNHHHHHLYACTVATVGCCRHELEEQLISLDIDNLSDSLDVWRHHRLAACKFWWCNKSSLLMSLWRAAKSSFWFKCTSLIYLIPNFKVILSISHTKIYHFTIYTKENKDNFTDNPGLRAFLWETELKKLLKMRGQSFFSTYACSQRI